jgi:arginine N-succinyltransferase
MLSRMGFRYVNRIDPFDGGPHYEARLAEVAPVKAHRRLVLAAAPLPEGTRDPEVLAAVTRASGPNRFRAVRTRARARAGRVQLPAAARLALGARAGDPVDVVPFG